MGLAVLGLQQSSVWGWGSPITWACIAAGLALLAVFVAYELRVANPLMQMRTFADRAFAVDNAILFLLMIPFVPLFFFASMYAQISLGESASETGLYLLIFFAGFAVASQWGGRILDRVGARRAVVLGCAVAAVGFALWANSLTELSVSSQWYYIVLAGAGVGLVLSPGQHRRAQPGARQPLRRGDRDHADGAQLRLQPRAGGARHGPDPAEQVEPGDDPAAQRACPRRTPTKSPTRSARARAPPAKQPPHVSGAVGKVFSSGPARFRPRLAHGLLRDGGGDGGRLRRRPDRDAGRQGRRAG